MSITLADIEKRIESLIEVHLVKFLPGTFWQDKIAHRLTDAIKSNLATHGLNHPIPHHFVLVVHPIVLEQWQKEPRLLDGLTKIFRLATSEAGVQFEIAPTITLTSSETIAQDEIEVQVADTGVAETQSQETATQEEITSAKTAFLIIGGTKVFTLQQVVTNIGRRLDNHVVVDDPRVSRYHSQIRYVRGRFVIFDLNSTGGTYVNGQRASQSVLYPGDVISLAGLPIIFGQDIPPQGLGSSGETAPLSPQSSERSTATLKTIPIKDDKK
jgi:pSer/pThr/pTyr-binding forkhead associated (FHA) protein